MIKKRVLRWVAVMTAVAMMPFLVSCGIKDSSERIKETKETKAGTTASAEGTAAEGTDGGMNESSAGLEQFSVPRMTKEEFPRIDGSTATIPLSVGLYRLTTGAGQKDAELAVNHTKTTNAYYSLMGGGTDLVIAYQASESFLKDLASSDTELDIRPIGKDALIFLTNEGNPVKSLTRLQIVDIYSGKIKRWSEVGGEDKEIVPFQRPEESGSQTLMKKLVMKEVPMEEPPTTLVESEMGELIDAVASYGNEENALGYSVYFYARNMYEQPGLRFMAVDQVVPSNETIKSGEYPYVNEFYAAIRKDEPKDSRAYQLFTWLTEEDGQAFIESLGYVGVKQVAREFPALPKEEENCGRLNLKENERLVISSGLADKGKGLVVYRNTGDEFQKLDQYGIRGFSAAVVTVDQPMILEDLTSDHLYEGVRALNSQDWIIPPEYNSIEKLDDHHYIGEKDYNYTLLDAAGNKILQLGDEHKNVQFLGGYAWCVDDTSGIAEVYDYSGRMVHMENFSQYGSFSYGSGTHAFQVYFNGGRGNLLFKPNGELLLDMENLPQDVVNQLQVPAGRTAYASAELDNLDIISIYNGNDTFVYDAGRKKLLSGPGDEVYFYSKEWGNAYSIKRGGTVQLYSSEGKPLYTKDGTPFTNALGNGWYSCIVDGVMIVGDGTGNSEYRYPGNFTGNSSAEVVEDGIFLLREYSDNKYRSYFYAGDKKLMERSYIYTDTWDGGLISATDEEGGSMVIDRSGTVVQMLEDAEAVYLVSPQAVVIGRSNYVYVLNSSGETVAKLLAGYMSDD